MKSDDLARAFGIEPYGEPATNITAIPQPPQKDMATFSKINAEQYAEMLRPHIGERLVLYGGGGQGGYLIKLIKIDIRPLGYDDATRAYHAINDNWLVEATIKYLEKAPAFISRPSTPHLGSWRLGTF